MGCAAPSRDAALFAMRRVGPERLAALRAYGRARDATMNDVLVTALYRSLFALVNPAPGEPCLITMPVNLRRYLRNGDALPVCNLSSVIQFVLSYEREIAFDATLARVRAAMQAAKSSHAGISSALLWELLLLPGFAVTESVLNRVLARVRASGATSLFFSNVGVMDAAQVDFGDVQVADAFGLGIVPFPPALTLVASTFRDTLTLTIGYCRTAFESQMIERFLDLFVGELPHAERSVLS
jgi:NRPS condensation-like uncharacterized protein